MENNNWININPTITLLPNFSGTFDLREYGCMVYDPLSRQVLDFEGYVESNLYPYIIYSNSLWSFDYPTSSLNLNKVNDWYSMSPGNGNHISAYPTNDQNPTMTDRHPTYCYCNGYLYFFSGLCYNIHTPKEFIPSDVDVSTSTFTVCATTPYQTGDEVFFRTSGTLPNPLQTSGTYHIIRLNSRQFRVSNTYGNAVSGINITFNDQGSGSKHILHRQLYHASDTWKYEITTKRWTQIFPPYTYYASFNNLTNACVYDEHNRKIVVGTLKHESSTSRTTWLFDPATETYENMSDMTVGNGTAPDIQSSNCMVYDGRRKVVWVFGCGNLFVGGNELWQFTGSTKTWVRVNQTGTIPTPRIFHTVVYIPKKDCLFVYGGTSGDSGPRLTDTWVYDLQTSAWSQLNPTTSPESSKMAFGAYDYHNDVVVIKNNSNKWWVFRYGNDIEVTKTLRL